MKFQIVVLFFFVAFLAYVNCSYEHEYHHQEEESGGIGVSFKDLGKGVGHGIVSKFIKSQKLLMHYFLKQIHYLQDKVIKGLAKTIEGLWEAFKFGR